MTHGTERPSLLAEERRHECGNEKRRIRHCGSHGGTILRFDVLGDLERQGAALCSPRRTAADAQQQCRRGAAACPGRRQPDALHAKPGYGAGGSVSSGGRRRWKKCRRHTVSHTVPMSAASSPSSLDDSTSFMAALHQVDQESVGGDEDGGASADNARPSEHP